MIRLVPRTATTDEIETENQTKKCPLIRLVPRTATRKVREESKESAVSVDQVGSKDSDQALVLYIYYIVGVR